MEIEEISPKTLNLIIKIQKRWRLKMNRKKLSKQYRKRRNIILEIISTEEEYVSKLKVMLEIFKPQIQRKGIITEKHLEKIFGNISIIFNINRSLLENLKEIDWVKKQKLNSFLKKKEEKIEDKKEEIQPSINEKKNRRKSISEHLMGLLKTEKSEIRDITRQNSKQEISRQNSKQEITRQNSLNGLKLNDAIKKEHKKESLFSDIQEVKESTASNESKKIGMIIPKFGKSISIGEIFRKLSPFLKVYSLYFSSYKESSQILNELRNSNPQFQQLLKTIKTTNKEVNKMDLSNFTIAPIQRIPRYQLILNELLENTPVEHYDYQDLLQCISLIQDVNKILDRNVKGKELQSVLEELKNKFEKNIIQPFRKLLRTGVFNLLKDSLFIQCQIYLFNDIFIFLYLDQKVIIHNIFLEIKNSDINRKRFQINFIVKEEEFIFETETEEECVDLINDFTFSKQEELKKFSNLFEKIINVKDVILAKQTSTKELLNKVPIFEKLYEFKIKGTNELEEIQNELDDYYKYGIIGKNSISKNEEEKIKLKLKLDDCIKRINSGSIIIYRLYTKIEESDFILLTLLRNDTISFEEYFGKKVNIDMNHLNEFIQSKETLDVSNDSLDLLLKKLNDMEINPLEILEKETDQLLLKHDDISKDILDLFDSYKLQLKNVQFLYKSLQFNQKNFEIQLNQEKEKYNKLFQEKELIEKDLEKKKEILDHVAKEKRKSQKKVEELSDFKKFDEMEKEIKELKELLKDKKSFNIFKK